MPGDNNYFFIDSHCHLSDDDIYADLNATIERASAANVKYLMSIGTNYDGSVKTIEIAESHDNVVCTVGTHPCELDGYDETKWDNLICRSKKIVGIGEIGLDYYHVKDDCGRREQKVVLESMLEIAGSHDMPCVFHVRDAFDDFLAMDLKDQPGVVHCFTGSLDDAKRCLDTGLYVSFSGIITFQGSASLRDVLKYIPHDRILIETDCPYLAPVPYRGKRNEPAFMASTAIFMSECMNISLEKLGRQTTENYLRLFGMARDAWGI